MTKVELKKIKLAYKNMLDRCYNEHNFSYQHYGGRGIKVCKAWLNSEAAFVAWATSNGHAVDLSLDRKNNAGDYSPRNCRWATTVEQLTNQRRNRRVTHAGRTQTLSQWAQELGVSADTIHKRLARGDAVARALTPGRLNPWKHGTRAGYEGHGCRCDLCRESNNQRHRERRKMKNALNDRLETGKEG